MPDPLAPKWWLVTWGQDNRRYALFSDEYTAGQFLNRGPTVSGGARMYPIITELSLSHFISLLT